MKNEFDLINIDVKWLFEMINYISRGFLMPIFTLFIMSTLNIEREMCAMKPNNAYLIAQ